MAETVNWEYVTTFSVRGGHVKAHVCEEGTILDCEACQGYIALEIPGGQESAEGEVAQRKVKAYATYIKDQILAFEAQHSQCAAKAAN